MTQIEQIKAEIERLMNWKPKAIPNGMRQRDVLNIRKGVLLTLKDFINSLPAEQPSEELDIDEELQRFFETEHLFVDADDLQTVRHFNGAPTDKRYYFEDIARHFAQWREKQLMKNVVETKVRGRIDGKGIFIDTDIPIGIDVNEDDEVKIIIIKENEI